MLWASVFCGLRSLSEARRDGDWHAQLPEAAQYHPAANRPIACARIASSIVGHTGCGGETIAGRSSHLFSFFGGDADGAVASRAE